MSKKLFSYLIFAISFVALFFRFYGLKDQGFIFFDEAAMVMRANWFKTLIFSDLNFLPSHMYVDSKVLWIVLILLSKLFILDSLYIAHYLSAVFGLLSIILTYRLSKRLFQLKSVAVLSAICLAISPYHIFYSRLALPESVSIFFLLLSLIFYLRTIQGAKSYLLWAVVFGAAAFLCTRFRVGLLPLFVLAMEWQQYRNQPYFYNHNKWRFPIFLFGFIIATLLGAKGLYGLLDIFGIELQSYFYGMKQHLSMHTSGPIDFLSFLSYPYILGEVEGVACYILFVFSLFFLKGNASTAFPLVCIILQIIVASFVDEKGARALSSVIPFLSILYAATIYNIYLRIRTKSYAMPAILCGLVVLLSISFAHGLQISQYKTDIKDAVEFINQQDPNSGIITTNAANVSVYSKSKKVMALLYQDFNEIENYYRNGFKYILIDPVKFGSSTINNYAFDIQFTPFLIFLERQCHPVAEYENYSLHLQNRYFLEGVRSLARTIHFYKYLNKESGKIKIYETGPCLEKYHKSL